MLAGERKYCSCTIKCSSEPSHDLHESSQSTTHDILMYGRVLLNRIDGTAGQHGMDGGPIPRMIFFSFVTILITGGKNPINWW